MEARGRCSEPEKIAARTMLESIEKDNNNYV